MIVDALIAVLVLLLIGSVPAWPYSRRWGYFGTSGIAVVLGVVILCAALHVF